MKALIKAVVSALLLTSALSSAQAQEKKEKKLEVRVFAYVMEETTGMPVPGVKVSILRAKDSTLVDSVTVQTIIPTLPAHQRG